MSDPGIITTQMIDQLINAPLVVADLTDHNPNVFYELAVRHAVKKPVVQLIQSGQDIPFDIATQRTIRVDHHDLDSVEDCKHELKRQIQSSEKNPDQADNPITTTVNIQALRESGNPVEATSAEILEVLQDILVKVSGGVGRPSLQGIEMERIIAVIQAMCQAAMAISSLVDSVDHAPERLKNIDILAAAIVHRGTLLLSTLGSSAIVRDPIPPDQWPGFTSAQRRYDTRKRRLSHGQVGPRGAGTGSP